MQFLLLPAGMAKMDKMHALRFVGFPGQEEKTRHRLVDGEYKLMSGYAFRAYPIRLQALWAA